MLDPGAVVACASVEELLGHVTCVYIATPPDSHAPLAAQCAAAKVPHRKAKRSRREGSGEGERGSLRGGVRVDTLSPT